MSHKGYLCIRTLIKSKLNIFYKKYCFDILKILFVEYAYEKVDTVVKFSLRCICVRTCLCPGLVALHISFKWLVLIKNYLARIITILQGCVAHNNKIADIVSGL